MEKFKQNDQFISKTRISPGHTRQNPVKLIGGISHDEIRRAYRKPGLFCNGSRWPVFRIDHELIPDELR